MEDVARELGRADESVRARERDDGAPALLPPDGIEARAEVGVAFEAREPGNDGTDHDEVGADLVGDFLRERAELIRREVTRDERDPRPRGHAGKKRARF
jgi:hypothetical protein